MALEADSNWGFRGEVTSAQTPLVLGRGVRYSVEGPTDLGVTIGGSGDRAVTVGSGTAWGDGVLSIWNAGATLNGDEVGSGSRWDTVVIRREWTPEDTPTGTATLMLLQGGSGQAVSPNRTTDAGVTTSDQPLALVRFQAGQTAAQQIVDLRTWAGLGGGMVAGSAAVTGFLDEVGTQFLVGSSQYTRRLNAGGAPEWFIADLAGLAGVTNLALDSSTMNSGGISGTRRYCIKNGQAYFQMQATATGNRTGADITILTFSNSAFTPMMSPAYGVVYVGGGQSVGRAYINASRQVHLDPVTFTTGQTIQVYITWPVAV